MSTNYLDKLVTFSFFATYLAACSSEVQKESLDSILESQISSPYYGGERPAILADGSYSIRISEQGEWRTINSNSAPSQEEGVYQMDYAEVQDVTFQISMTKSSTLQCSDIYGGVGDSICAAARSVSHNGALESGQSFQVTLQHGIIRYHEDASGSRIVPRSKLFPIGYVDRQMSY
ncbi:MAG: hypothetical protein VXW22_03645 [Pseudomonadota bacterium]|nr:hypothetical protein [Pseudomonadota bacterium]